MDSDSRGDVVDSYVAAIQHDHVDVDGYRVVGVVRKPTHWFHDVVDVNHRALGPPENLLEEVKSRADELRNDGVDDDEAAWSAWREVEFERRYLTHLEESEDAESSLHEVESLVLDGVDVCFVCYEDTDRKPCHRVPLKQMLLRRLNG